MAELDKHSLIQLKQEIQSVLERYSRHLEDLEIIPISQMLSSKPELKISDLKLYLSPARSREFLELYSLLNPEFQLEGDRLLRRSSAGQLRIEAHRIADRVRFSFKLGELPINPRSWILVGDRILDLISPEIQIAAQEFRVYARYQLESGEAIHGTALFKLDQLPQLAQPAPTIPAAIPTAQPRIQLRDYLESAQHPILDLAQLGVDRASLEWLSQSRDHLWIQQLNWVIIPRNLELTKIEIEHCSKLEQLRAKLLEFGICLFSQNSALVSHGFLRAKLCEYFSRAFNLELDQDSLIKFLGSMLDSLGRAALESQLSGFLRSLGLEPHPQDLAQLIQLIGFWRAAPKIQPTLASQQQIGALCPYCRTPIKSGNLIIICPRCSTAHHLECWNVSKGCGLYGCGFKAG